MRDNLMIMAFVVAHSDVVTSVSSFMTACMHMSAGDPCWVAVCLALVSCISALVLGFKVRGGTYCSCSCSAWRCHFFYDFVLLEGTMHCYYRCETHRLHLVELKY